MSADNGIYVLESKVSKIGSVWRVAHSQGVQSELEWYLENEPYNVGAFLHSVFGKSLGWATESAALDYAHKLSEDFSYLEHGVVCLKLPFKFTLYGD
jgi:hypothetical protein